MKFVASISKLLYAAFVLYTIMGTVLWAVPFDLSEDVLKGMEELSSETKFASKMLQALPVEGGWLLGCWIFISIMSLLASYVNGGAIYQLTVKIDEFAKTLTWRREARRWTDTENLRKFAGRKVPEGYADDVRDAASEILKKNLFLESGPASWSTLHDGRFLSQVKGQDYRKMFEDLVLHRILYEMPPDTDLYYMGFQSSRYYSCIIEEWSMKLGLLLPGERYGTHVLLSKTIVKPMNQWVAIYALDAMDACLGINEWNRSPEELQRYRKAIENLEAVADLPGVATFLSDISMVPYSAEAPGISVSHSWTVKEWVVDNAMESKKLNDQRKGYPKLPIRLHSGGGCILTKINAIPSSLNNTLTVTAVKTTKTERQGIEIKVKLDEQVECIIQDADGTNLAEKASLLRGVLKENPVRLEWLTNEMIDKFEGTR